LTRERAGKISTEAAQSIPRVTFLVADRLGIGFF